MVTFCYLATQITNAVLPLPLPIPWCYDDRSTSIRDQDAITLSPKLLNYVVFFSFCTVWEKSWSMHENCYRIMAREKSKDTLRTLLVDSLELERLCSSLAAQPCSIFTCFKLLSTVGNSWPEYVHRAASQKSSEWGTHWSWTKTGKKSTFPHYFWELSTLLFERYFVWEPTWTTFNINVFRSWWCHVTKSFEK